MTSAPTCAYIALSVTTMNHRGTSVSAASIDVDHVRRVSTDGKGCLS